MEFASAARVNSLIYISVLKASEDYIIQDTVRDLRPFFESISLPFLVYRIKNKQQLIDLFSELRRASDVGLLPMVHIVGHGVKDAGLSISDVNEMVYWDDLGVLLREINVSCGNNLCVIASSCFGFEAIEDVKIMQPSPFYMLIAPQHTLSISTFVSSTLPFYRAIFSGLDIIEAYNQILSQHMSIFHCEKMFIVAFLKYISDNCYGDGREKRIDYLVEEALQSNIFPRTPDNIKIIREFASKFLEPSQELLDRFSSTFLLGRDPGAKLDDILQLIGVTPANSEK